MSKINLYDIERLKNVNEQRVWDLLAEYVSQDSNLCTCSICIMDIAAITLNNIPPHYQAFEDTVDEAVNKTSDDDIIEQIMIAVEKVKKFPHHM